MSQINPLAHVVFQHIEAQRQGAAAKGRQLLHAQIQEKDIAAQDDVLEHQVESTEEDQPPLDKDGQQKRQPKRQQKHHDPDEPEDPHIDLTA